MKERASGNPIVQADKDGVWEMGPDGLHCVAEAKDIIRTATKEDVPAIIAIFQHPEIRDSIGDVPMSPMAVEAALDHLIVLLWRKSLFMLARVSDEVLEVHVAVHPEDRGRPALVAATTAVAMCFLASPCREIVGKTPKMNIGGQYFNVWAGFKKVGERARTSLWSLSVVEWASKLPSDEQRMIALHQARATGQYGKIRSAIARAEWERRFFGGF